MEPQLPYPSRGGVDAHPGGDPRVQRCRGRTDLESSHLTGGQWSLFSSRVLLLCQPVRLGLSVCTTCLPGVWGVPSPPVSATVLASLLESDPARPGEASLPPAPPCPRDPWGFLGPAMGTFWKVLASRNSRPQIAGVTLCEFGWIPWCSTVLGVRAGVWPMAAWVSQQNLSFLFRKRV